MIKWNELEAVDQLAAVDAESAEHPVLLFKHSTRCNISAAALARFERSWESTSPIKPYYIDLISFRALSNEIASRYGVEHQSPQALVIKNGKCVYTESHMSIDINEILAVL
jgi:bacillithiol system protein YtxJ